MAREGGRARRGVREPPTDSRGARSSAAATPERATGAPECASLRHRGMRRTHLRGHTNILKRLFVHIGDFNLGLLMRTLIGVGTPRGLQGRVAALVGRITAILRWSPSYLRDTDAASADR